MRDSVTLGLIHMIHSLQNYTEGMYPKHRVVEDDEVEVLDEMDLPTPQVINSLRAMIPLLQNALPIIRLAEEYMEGDIDNDIFNNRFQFIQDQIEVKITPEVQDSLKRIFQEKK